MGSRRWCALFVAGAVAVGAAGCGGGDDPKPGGFSLGTASPEAATSSTTSPAPSPSSTKDADGDYVLPGGGYDVLANMPPEAKERSRKGVMAFTKYYFVAVSKVQQKPVVGQLPLICTPECEDCRAGEEGAQEKVQEKERFDGQMFEVQGAGGEPTPSPDDETAESVRLIAMVDVRPVQLLNSRGQVIGETPGAHQMLGEMTVVWRDERWRMANVNGSTVVPSK